MGLRSRLSAHVTYHENIIADLASELIDEHLKCIASSIGREVDCWSEIASIFSILELDNNRWDRRLGRRRNSRLERLRVRRLLSLWWR
jgi:hypothetical protein